MSRDILVTGIGIVSPAGSNAEATWQSLLAGGRFVQLLGRDVQDCVPVGGAPPVRGAARARESLLPLVRESLLTPQPVEIPPREIAAASRVRESLPPPELFPTPANPPPPAARQPDTPSARSWRQLAAHRLGPVCAAPAGGFSPPPGTADWDRLCQMAAAAADGAVEHYCDLKASNRRLKALVSFGSSKGGLDSFSSLLARASHKYNEFLTHNKPTEVLPDYIRDIPPNSPSARLTDRFAAIGAHATVTACTTGALAVIRGAQMIADGDADLVICGGADASLHPLWLAAFKQMGVLAPPDPVHGAAFACRPFDRGRRGFAVGEGAGVLVLESAESAHRRGAEAIGRIAGWAMGTDPCGLTQLSPDGEPLAHVIRLACARAGCDPQQLACVHAHGTGTLSNDQVEANALWLAIGRALEDIPVVSMKGAIGHLLGGAGAVELALAVLACRDRRTPGTATLIEPDPKLGPLNLPAEPTELRPGPILKTALGFGGHVAAVVVAPA